MSLIFRNLLFLVIFPAKIFFCYHQKFSFFSYNFVEFNFPLLYHLNHFKLVYICMRCVKIMCGTVPKGEGSDDNYLARYDKLIVTRSIFVFLIFPRRRVWALYNVLAPFTTERIMNDGATLFFSRSVDRKAIFHQAVNITIFSPDVTPGSELPRAEPKALRESKTTSSIVISFRFSPAFLCSTIRGFFSPRQKLKTNNFHESLLVI